MAKKEFEVGEAVKLSNRAIPHRIDGMRRWTGIVDGIEYFSLRWQKQDLGRNKWVRVDWGLHRDDRRNYVWLEKEEDLVRA